MNLDLIKTLCLSFGTSGRESKIAEIIKEKIEPFCKVCEKDKFGNLFCRKTDEKGLLNVVLDAHTDTVGLVVKEVSDNGFLKFSALGGVDPRVLPGLEVAVHGKKDILGVITSKPPHLMSGEDKKKAPKISDMFIDTGLLNADEFISAGDVVTYRRSLEKMGDCITGTYLDDRACCSAIIEIFENLKDVKLPFNLIASFSVQEELGLLGAKSQNLNPDIVIALDVTHGETPDEKSDLVFKCGKGAAIGCGPSLSKELYGLIKTAAQKKELDFQTEILEASSGTNAWGYQIAPKPAACAVVSLPLRFMHTPVETAAISDYDNMIDIVTEFLKNADKKSLENIVNDRILR